MKQRVLKREIIGNKSFFDLKSTDISNIYNINGKHISVYAIDVNAKELSVIGEYEALYITFLESN